MKNAVIYIHGKGGNAEEADYYKKFFSDEYDIIGFAYKSELPWDTKEEFPKFFDFIAPQYGKIFLIANSIGAYYAMLSLADKPIEKAMFISPIVDMEKLILNINDLVKRNRGRTAQRKGNRDILWRNVILGISFLCEKSSHKLAYPNQYSLRRER